MATDTQIEPGTTVRIEIVKDPTSEAAVKTLRRLMTHDPEIAAIKKREKASRAASMRVKRRGGRPWEHRPTMRPVIKAEVGEVATVYATLDLIRDIKSVERFVTTTVVN